ncbi:hypothetical protein EDD16DRAFT_1525144 [Pisolithus croceorrhizus]|nr:hypothetical protein EDD16DRAFT_1525144 [Pisolithus croceorrhizus]
MSWSISLCQTVCRLGALWLSLALVAGLRKSGVKVLRERKLRRRGALWSVLTEAVLLITESNEFASSVSHVMASINVALSIHGDKFEREYSTLDTQVHRMPGGEEMGISTIMLSLKYRHSATHLVVIDLEGCLWVRDMSKSAMIGMMRSGKGPMIEFPKATIWWVACYKGALEWLAERVPSMGIVAENRCYVKTREIGSKFNEQSTRARWINMVTNMDFAWEGPCIEILSHFTEWKPGSFVREQATSIMWPLWICPAS